VSSYLLSVLLGVIEGLTEFLPVSSTAHLRIIEGWLGIALSDPYWKMFSVVIQLGAILCLPLYFRSRLWKFISTFPRGESGQGSFWSHPLTLTGIAFLVTAVPALLLTKVIGKNLGSLFVMGVSLMVGGVVMWAVDVAYGERKGGAEANAATTKSWTASVEQMSPRQAAWVGFCQIFSAVFPGTSRSMATIAGGQLAGMTRPAALEFSFLLSIPTMVAATGYDLLKSLRHREGALGSGPHDLHGWLVLGVGFAVSFVVAYAVVAWFMRWVRTRGFVPFAIYRIIFGAIVLVLLYSGRASSKRVRSITQRKLFSARPELQERSGFCPRRRAGSGSVSRHPTGSADHDSERAAGGGEDPARRPARRTRER